MTQEEKDLLLNDLCTRLPYGIKLSYRCNHIHILKAVHTSSLIVINDIITNIITTTDVENIKPYLFPLSSMTEEQKKEFKEISKCKDEIEDYSGFDSKGVYLIEIGKYEYEYDTNTTVEEFYFNEEIIDWFNENHFDYRGLIPMNLANDATGLNIY